MVVQQGGSVTIEATFKDEDGNLYEPTSQTLEFYDPTGTLITSKTQADCTNEGLGVWSIIYDVAETAVVGKWLCHWTTKVGSKYYPNSFFFIVWEKSVVSIEDIRHALNDMSIQRVDDDVVMFNIERANNRVRKVASTQALEKDIVNAITACAAYATYLSYSIEVERASGGLPPVVNTNLTRLYDECLFWRGIIQGATATTNPGQIFGKLGLPKSLYDDPSRDPSSRGRTETG